MSDKGLPRKWYLSPRFLAGKVREKGLLYCLWNGALILFGLIVKLIVILVFRYPLYYLGVRFLPRYISFVGHLACDTDCYVKEGILGMRPHHFGILLAPPGVVANPHLLDYWRQYLTIISSPFLCKMLEPLSRDKKLEYVILYCSGKISQHKINTFPAIQRAWGDRPSLLTLREADRERGWNCLQSLGVPKDAWFVCFHCREPGYVYPRHTPEQSQAYHKIQHHRNADIYTYIPAMRAIVERGGWCIRMGDPATKPLPLMEKVIDYAHLPVKSNWMDVFLCASCRFFLGGSSGLMGIASVFGITGATANIGDMGAVLGHGPRGINILKLVWSLSEERYLTFKEVFDSPISHFFYGFEYDDAGVRVVDNSPEDIRDLALEMLDRIEGKAIYTAQDERLQERFISLLRPGHYSYGGSSRVGRDFLRRYTWLLPNEEV